MSIFRPHNSPKKLHISPALANLRDAVAPIWPELTCDSFHGTFGEFYEAIILTAIVSITSSPCKKRVDELPNHLAIILKLPQYANDITFFCKL